MCNFVCQPERYQGGVETEALCIGVCHPGEMLEAHEGDSTAIGNELAGVSGADADHKYHIDVGIELEQRAAAVFRLSRERNDISSFQHGAEIMAIGPHDRARYVVKVRCIGVEYVVAPVWLENAEVGRVVAPVRGDWV